MKGLCGVLATVLLILITCHGAAAQVRDRPRPAAAAELGMIAGRVDVESDRQRAPIRHARVTATAEAGGRPSITTTDADGRYQLERLAAGTYRVRVEKLGFVPISTDQPAPVLIKAGATVTVDVLMQRGAALEGQFLDDRGNGIQRLTVYADRLAGPTDRRTVIEKRSATADDLGRFRLHTLRPGTYLIHAWAPPPAAGEVLYYRGTSNSSQASVLTVAAGQTIDHLEFQVAAAPLSQIAAEALAASAQETTATAGELPAAVVTGRLTRSDTGAPVANALVRLVSVLGGAAAATARSNDRGQFQFAGVSPGPYRMFAEANGLVSMNGSSKTIEVKERERIESVNLTVAPPGAIEGRVLDEFGDPAPGVSVQITQLRQSLGGPVFLPVPSNASTGPSDDRGWFRSYGLSPGDYYVLAPSTALSPLAGGPTSAAAPDVADNTSTGFATTFFPGTVSVNAVRPVHVAEGADTRDVTFGLVGARMVAISGAAIDSSGQPVSNARLMLIQTHDGAVRTQVGITTVADANGSFRFPSVPEGAYVLQGFGSKLFGSLPVAAAAAFPRTPVAVTILLRPLTTARGHVSFDGDLAIPSVASVSVQFQPTDFINGPAGGNAIITRFTPTWDFEIPNLAWTGVIRTFGPPGWYLKSVRLEGRDITDTPYDFQSADVNGIEVVLTSRVGSVVGTVVDVGKAAANSGIIVFATDEARWMLPSQFTAATEPDPQGVFRIRGLLPGRYYAVAIPQQTPLPRIDHDGLAALRPFATVIEVSEGVETSVTLTVVKR